MPGVSTKKFLTELDNDLKASGIFSSKTILVEVYRDGPRFYSACVSDGETKYQIKDIVKRESSKNAEYIHTPANHLRTEIDILGYLTDHGLAIAPKLIAESHDKNPWYVAEHITDDYLGTNISPFFYEQEVLRRTKPEAIFKNIQIIQGLTHQPDLPSWLTKQSRVRARNNKSESPNIKFFANAVDWPKKRVGQAFHIAVAIHAQLPQVLTHGEVYPQHIYVGGDGKHVKFIDWENTRLGNAYSDHVAVWLRTFEEPAWQSAYLELVMEQEGFDQDAWDANVFLSAMGVYRYLCGDRDQMERTRRQTAAGYCRQVACDAANHLLDHANL